RLNYPSPVQQLVRHRSFSSPIAAPEKQSPGLAKTGSGSWDSPKPISGWSASGEHLPETVCPEEASPADQAKPPNQVGRGFFVLGARATREVPVGYLSAQTGIWPVVPVSSAGVAPAISPEPARF